MRGMRHCSVQLWTHHLRPSLSSLHYQLHWLVESVHQSPELDADIPGPVQTHTATSLGQPTASTSAPPAQSTNITHSSGMLVFHIQLYSTQISINPSASLRPYHIYTVSGKKEATLFSTTTLAFLGRFL